MTSPTLVGATHEKGWGTLFDVRLGGREFHFSISAATLQTSGLRHRTKKIFPDVFEANVPTLMRVALLLIESGRINPSIDIGGTEILPEHIIEACNA
jgi:hypothetical protein